MTKDSVKAVVGGNIERLRHEMGLSQSQLGNRLEQWLSTSWSRAAVSNAESGKRSFGIDDLVGICIALKVDLRQLLSPPPGVNTIVLASGMEVPAPFLLETVAGADTGGERSKLTGAAEALDAASALLAERAERLREKQWDPQDDIGRFVSW